MLYSPPGAEVSTSANEWGIDMSKILSYLNEEDGASAAEYALILAIVGSAIAVAMLALGSSISNAINNAKNCINTPSSCAG
jgi:pilus assembly protein Flp/PilA